MTLPTSCQLPSHRLAISPHPFATGGYGDVYLANLDGSTVRVKRVRVPHQKCLPAAEKVRIDAGALQPAIAHQIRRVSVKG